MPHDSFLSQHVQVKVGNKQSYFSYSNGWHTQSVFVGSSSQLLVVKCSRMLNAGSAGHGFTSGSRKSEAGIIKFLSNQFGDQLKQMILLLGIFYNRASFKSSMDQCFKQLSKMLISDYGFFHNSFYALCMCIKSVEKSKSSEKVTIREQRKKLPQTIKWLPSTP